MGNRRVKPQRLAAKLLALRHHLGMSQFKMAQLLDADMQYTRISEWERGRREPNLMQILQYAKGSERECGKFD
jgi:DNA-binding transcriptional regulator YiaG